jgi:hypothetical protein
MEVQVTMGDAFYRTSQRPGSARDWTLAPDWETKQRSCMKMIDVIVHGNTKIIVDIHRCCLCSWCRGLGRPFWVKRQILVRHSPWYSSFIMDADYMDTERKMESAYLEYYSLHAVGTWLVMTEYPILEESLVLPPIVVAQQVDRMLRSRYQCRESDYEPSRALFAVRENRKSVTPEVIVVSDSRTQVLSKLIRAGWELTHTVGTAYFLDSMVEHPEDYVEEVLRKKILRVEWITH